MLIALLFAALPITADTTLCVDAAAFLRSAPHMVAEITPDIVNDWRSGQRLSGCRITAAGGHRAGVARAAEQLYEQIRAAGWTRTPEPRDAPNEASLRYRKGKADCLFNVNREAMLFTDAEDRVNEALTLAPGDVRYQVFVICLPIVAARDRGVPSPLRELSAPSRRE